MYRKIWTKQEIKQFKKLYPNTKMDELTKLFDCPKHKIYQQALRLKLKRTKAFLQENSYLKKGSILGAEFRYSPGTAPPNKGKKQTEYMSASAILRTKKTRFKKGNLPHNTKKDGIITVRTDNRGVKEKYIRISKANWVPLRRYLWQKHKGKIPKAMLVIYKDGNTENCVIKNLLLMTKSENMKRNTIHQYPEELQQVIRLTGKLKRTINKKQNG